MTIADPPDEYYDDSYAVYCLDPDGLERAAVCCGRSMIEAAMLNRRLGPNRPAWAMAVAGTGSATIESFHNL